MPAIAFNHYHRYDDLTRHERAGVVRAEVKLRPWTVDDRPQQKDRGYKSLVFYRQRSIVYRLIYPIFPVR